MQVEVILASQGPNQKPIYTIRLRYPRIIHAELMTHRLFSRNARSSRAVPVKTMLLETTSIPFVPWHWGKNQKGMQADEELSTEQIELSKYIWNAARLDTVGRVEALMELGLHKQIPNRLLEPFSWIDTLVTATDWDNFLWLREHGDAEPHLQDLARLVHQAIKAAEIQMLEPGEWHLPYITAEDVAISKGWQMPSEWLCKISAARCARISYKPFDGDASYEREIGRYDSLVTSDRVHASPLEHQATPDQAVTISADVFEQDNRTLSPDGFFEAREGFLHEELHGNFNGYIQYRKTVPNEAKMEGVL